MENNNGALSFDVLIRDSNLQAMLDKDERRIMEFTETVEGAGNSIESSWGNIGKVIGGVAVGAMLQSWVQDIVRTRGEFQQLEIAFNTMLGSVERGTQLMQQLTQTAASTPFDLQGIAGSAKQLLAYGTAAEEVNDTLVMLGNIASGLSLPLNDLVYLYGTTMVQGRLFTQDVRQFMGRGIPLVQELSKQLGKTTEEINAMVTAGQIGFPEVQKVLQNLTAEGGMFYNLMEEQSASLTGQISNLGDAWDMMLNEMGQSSQGFLSGSISLAATLVENYKTVLGVLGGLITLYGTYKVALATIAIQQGKLTGMQKIDNIVLAARGGLFKANGGYMQAYAAQHGALTQAQAAYNVELEKSLSVEQQAQVLRQVRIAAIQQLMTAQQAEFVSQANLTAGSAEYLAMCESVLTADQRKELAKQNLTKTSMAYGVAVRQAIQAQEQENAATNESLVVQARAAKAKEAQLLAEYRLSQNKIQQTRVQIALAQAEGETEAVAALKQQQHNQLKQHAVIVSELKAAKLKKEALTQQIANVATQQATIAETKDAAAKTLQTNTTSLLSTATTFLTAKLKALWATLLANPFTAIISLVGLAASAFMMFRKEEDQATAIAGEFNDAVSESYGKLNLYFAILKTAESGSKDYESALSKVNSMCDQYNLTLLDTNATLQDQIDKHDQLVEAVERTAAAKISAKYKEEEMNKALEQQKKLLEDLQKAAKSANHKEIQLTTQQDPDGVTTQVSKAVDVASSNIRGATDALWAYVQSKAIEGSGELQNLTGEAYQKTYDQLVNNILESVKETTHATSKEMETFEGEIKKMVDGVIASQQRMQANMQLIDAQLEQFGSGFQADEVKEKPDITTLSLEELHKKVAELDGATVNIDFKAWGYESVKEMLDAVKGEISTKQKALNTENDISAEVKRLQDLRKSTKLGSAEWKEYNKQITTLQARLPKTGQSAQQAAQRIADAQREVAQKEKELAADVEDSKLALIKDGYAKRVAELNVQHQKELARIDKEQAELEKKYRDAKKKMPQATVDMFNQLRNNENASFEIALTELTQDEMDVRKKQYQQYYKWVATYGVQAAQQQFADLMKEGESWEQWLVAKATALAQKQREQGSLNETDSNALIMYQQEIQAVRGVKTAMDKFNESLEKTKDNAETTGDLLIALADIRDRLQRGEFNLIGEEKITALLAVEKQITQTTEEFQRQLLETYKTNAQQRLDVEKQYDQEITWLKQHGYAQQAALAEKAKNKAIAELQSTQIQGTEQWQQLFQNAQYLSGSAFDAILQQLRDMIAKIKDSGVRDALNQQLDALRAQTQGSKNPFKLLVDSIKEYNKAADGTIEKKAEFTAMFNSIGDTLGQVKGSFDSIVSSLKDIGAAGDEETQKVLGDVSKMIGGAESLAKGIATGNPMDIISGGVSLITSAISLFDSTSRRIRREMKQHEKQLKVLQRAYAQISWETDNAVGEGYYSSAQKEIENLKQQKKEYEELARLEQSKKSKDRDDNKVQEYLQNAEDAERKIKDLEKEIKENLVQTNFKELANELADAWAQAFSDMEDSTESFEEIWKTTIANAVKNALKLKLIEPIVNQFTSTMADYMGAHNNSVAGFNFDYWKKMLQNAGNSFTDALGEFEEFFRDMGDEIENADTLEGQVKSVTEETASKLAGEITSIRIRQVDMLLVQQDIRSSMESVGASIRSALTYLNTISTNTGSTSRHLSDIKTQLTGLQATIASDPLRAKGLTS